MIVLFVVGMVVLAFLGAVATWMAVVGLMGVTGSFGVRRCPTCGHLWPGSRGQSVLCPYCRHPRLSHRFAHARLRHVSARES